MRNDKIKRVIIPAVAVITTAVTTAAFFMKRHAKKSLYTAVALIAVMIFGGASMTAYAAEVNGEPDLSEILTPVVAPAGTPEPATTPQPTAPPEPAPIVPQSITATEPITTIEPESTQTPDRNPNQLTPPGNLSLVDDLSGAQTDGKQFITVVTKSGAYFYLVIDRNSNKDNVYFLNLVDEADLMAIMQKDKTTTTTTAPASVTPTPEQTPATDTTPAPKKSNMAGILIVLLIIGAAGGGAYYYFRVRKPKQGAKVTPTTELDDFDFDGDEDDIINDDVGEPHGDIVIGEDVPDFTLTDESADIVNDDFGVDTPESEGKDE